MSGYGQNFVYGQSSLYKDEGEETVQAAAPFYKSNHADEAVALLLAQFRRNQNE